jgi:uncharacterized membrane protein YphA (DoxX/SURF4 family)
MKASINTWILTLLRIAIGWHFLYEGLVKLISGNWSAAAYLVNANWIFEGLFHRMAENPGVLDVIDFLNIWGLILIGASLMLGIFIKISSLAGFMLLLVYFIANPSLPGLQFNSVSSEGNYLVINKNIIEAIALLFIAFAKDSKIISVERLFKNLYPYFRNYAATADKQFTEPAKESDSSRRSFIEGLLVIPFAGAFLWAFQKKRKYISVDSYTGATTLYKPEKGLKEQIAENNFTANIKGTEISRLILGPGTIGGWPHSRDLAYVKPLMRSYNTTERIYSTLKLAEESGINTVNLQNSQMHLLNTYNREYEGKLKSIVAVLVNNDNYQDEIGKAINSGATMIYIHPNVTDRWIDRNQPGLIPEVLEYSQKNGIITGIGCYSIEAVLYCENLDYKPDFYMKSIHTDDYWSTIPRENRNPFLPAYRNFYKDRDKFHDNIFDMYPEKTRDVMKTVGKPWIGFKTMASGAIPPAEAFRFAFESGTDIISAGMFDFQLNGNIKTCLQVLKDLGIREREWRA